MVAYVTFTGRFDNMGIAEGKVDQRLGAIKEMRLTVHSESENWAILSEVNYHYHMNIQSEIIEDVRNSI